MPELGFRVRRQERRRRIIQLSGAVVGLLAIGFTAGYFTRKNTFVPVDGGTPVTCVTLAIIPSDVLPKPKYVKVNVLNGSHRVGMAGITADILKQRGFKVATIGNFADYFVKGAAEIHYGPAGAQQAQVLQGYLDSVKMVQDKRSGKVIDFIVGQAFSDIYSSEKAAIELARPSASPSGPGC